MRGLLSSSLWRRWCESNARPGGPGPALSRRGGTPAAFISVWRRVEVLIPMHGCSMHHPLSKRRRAPARLTLLVPAPGIEPGSLPYGGSVLPLDEAGELSWSRPPGLHRHRSLTGRESCGWTRAAWSRWRELNPRSGLTKTVDCRYPTPAWCPREGSHLRFFHVTEAVCC